MSMDSVSEARDAYRFIARHVGGLVAVYAAAVRLRAWSGNVCEEWADPGEEMPGRLYV